MSAIFALTAIGVCALQLALLAHSARVQTEATGAQLQSAARHLDATITDLDRTVQIAGGAINTARQIERDNRSEIAQVNRETLATVRQVSALVASLDATQKQAGKSIADTSAALVPVIAQSAEDLRELKPAIAQMTPLLQQSTAIAQHLEGSTADVQHEIHKLVYQPPRKWYQKYFLDPLRTAAHLLTIPIKP